MVMHKMISVYHFGICVRDIIDVCLDFAHTQKMYMSNKERELISALISLNKDFTCSQQQRLEAPVITLIWHTRYINSAKSKGILCMSWCFLWFSLKWIFETGYDMTRTVSTEL